MIIVLSSSIVLFALINFVLQVRVPTPYKISMMQPSRAKRKAFWEYTGNYTAIIHALTSLMASILILIPQGLELMKHNTLLENCLTAYSLGYYMVDTLFGLLFGFNEGLLLFHHVECILSLVYTLYKDQYANPVIWALAIAEISNPLILLRKNLQKHKSLDRAADIVGIIFSLLFITTRTYLISLVATPLFISEVSLALKLHCGLLWFISLYWCYTIINMLTKALYEMTKSSVFRYTHENLRKARKNGVFMFGLHGIFFSVCFLKTIASWNHREVF